MITRSSALGFAFGLLVGLILSFSTASTETLLPPIASIVARPQTTPDWMPRTRRKYPNRVFCWTPLLNYTTAVETRAREYWPRLCDGFRFYATDADLEHGIIGHGYKRLGPRDLWNQIHRGWARIAEEFGNDFDWFVKLDSDTLFFPSNLVALANQSNWKPDDLVYFGRTLFEQSRPVNEVRAQFNVGAGYGISRGLLKALYPYWPTSRVVNDTWTKCPEWERWGEDVKFADCLRFAFPNFIPNNTRDAWDRDTFMPYDAGFHMLRSPPDWMVKGQDPARLQRTRITRCCSSRPVVWHKIRGSMPWNYYAFVEIAVDPRPPLDGEFVW